MVLWAQGKREACPDKPGRDPTQSTFTLSKNLKSCGVNRGDWLDQWYPPETTPTVKAFKNKSDHVDMKSRWDWEKRPEPKLHRYQSPPRIHKSSKEEMMSQGVYSIISNQHFDSDAYLHARSIGEEQRDLCILNKIAKHILKLDRSRDHPTRSLASSQFEAKEKEPREIRDPTLPSPRNVEGALASPFYDPDFWVPRRPLAPNRVYHFHVIYNHALSCYGRTSDTDLALRVTASLVEKLELRGYVNGYYHDRDRRSEHTLTAEMDRVITGSSLTILLLTPGFVRDCLDRYLQIEAFRKLLTEPNSHRNQLVIIGVGVTEASLPLVFGRHEVLFFKENDWETDHPTWARLDSVLLGNLGKKDFINTPNAASQRTQGEFYAIDFQNTCHGVSSTDRSGSVYESQKVSLNIPGFAYKQGDIAQSTEGFRCIGKRENEQRQRETGLGRRDGSSSSDKNLTLTKHWVHHYDETAKVTAPAGEKAESRCARKYPNMQKRGTCAVESDVNRLGPKSSTHLEETSPNNKYFRLTEHFLYADDLHNLGQDHVAWDPGGQLNDTSHAALYHRDKQFALDLRCGSENGDKYENSSDSGSDLTLLENSFDSFEFERDLSEKFYGLASFEDNFDRTEPLGATLENTGHRKPLEQNEAIEEFELGIIEDDSFEDSTTASVHTLDNLELDDMRRRYGFEKFSDATFGNEPFDFMCNGEHTLDSLELQDMRRRYGFEELEMDTARTESSVCSLDTVGLEEIRERYGFGRLDVLGAQNIIDDHDFLDGTNRKFLGHALHNISVDEFLENEQLECVQVTKENRAREFNLGMKFLMQETNVINSIAPEDTRYITRNQWRYETFKNEEQLEDLSWLTQKSFDHYDFHYDRGEINLSESETPTIEELWAKWVDCPSMETDETHESIQQTYCNNPYTYRKNSVDKAQLTLLEKEQSSQDLPSLYERAYAPWAQVSKPSIPSENIEQISEHNVSHSVGAIITDDGENTVKKSPICPSEAIDGCGVDIVEEITNDKHAQESKQIQSQIAAFDTGVIDCVNYAQQDKENAKFSVTNNDLQISNANEPVFDPMNDGRNVFFEDAKEMTESSVLNGTQNEEYQETEPFNNTNDDTPKDAMTDFAARKTELVDQVDSAVRTDFTSSFVKEVQVTDEFYVIPKSQDVGNLSAQSYKIISANQSPLHQNDLVRETQVTKQDEDGHSITTHLTTTCNEVKGNMAEALDDYIPSTKNGNSLNDSPRNDFTKGARLLEANKIDTISRVHDMQLDVENENSCFEETLVTNITGRETTEHRQIAICTVEIHIDRIDENKGIAFSDTISPEDSVTHSETEIIEETENPSHCQVSKQTVNNIGPYTIPGEDVHNSVPKVIHIEAYKETSEASIIDQPETPTKYSRAQKNTKENRNSNAKEVILDDSQAKTQGAKTLNKVPETTISLHPKNEDVETPQLNIVALNVAHEILTHMLMAKTEKSATQKKYGEVAQAPSPSTVGENFEYEKEPVVKQSPTARRNEDPNEIHKTCLPIQNPSEEEEEYHKQVLSKIESISYDEENFVSKLELEDGEISVAASILPIKINKDSSLIIEESSVECGLESMSTFEDIECTSHSLENLSNTQEKVNVELGSPEIESVQNEKHLNKDCSVINQESEANDSSSEEREVKDVVYLSESQKVVEPMLRTETTSDYLIHDKASGTAEKPNCCEQMALNSINETSPLDSNMSQKELKTNINENFNVPLVYDMSNVARVQAVARNIVKGVLASSVNRLSEGMCGDIKNSQQEYKVSKVSESNFENSVFQNNTTDSANHIQGNEEQQPFRVEIDAESSFSEIQFRQASSPRTRADDVCHESFPSAVSSIEDVLIFLHTEEQDAGPLLLGDLQHEGAEINVNDSTSIISSEVTVCEEQLVSETNMTGEENVAVSIDLKAEKEDSYNGAVFRPWNQYYNEEDSGYFDPCDSTVSRDESEINFDHRATTSQRSDNREVNSRVQAGSEHHPANATLSVQRNEEIQGFKEEVKEDTNRKETTKTFDDFETNFTQSIDTLSMNTLEDTDEFGSVTGAAGGSIEIDNEEKGNFSAYAESFYFREKALCEKEDLYSSDSQAEFRHPDYSFSQQLEMTIQSTTNRPGILLQENTTNTLQNINLFPQTKNDALLFGRNEDSVTDVQASFADQACYINLEETELVQNISVDKHQHALDDDEATQINDCLLTRQIEQQTGGIQGIYRDIEPFDRSHHSSSDTQPSTFGQLIHQYAPQVRFDQEIDVNIPFQNPHEEPFRDIHVVGVDQEGIHRTLEQPCFTTDDSTQLRLTALGSQSPRLVSLVSSFGLSPRTEGCGETDDSNVSERLTVDHPSALFRSPRLFSPRSTSQMTPRSRSNFERLRAMHRQMHGISTAGLQLTDSSMSESLEIETSSNTDGEAAATDANSQSAEQTKVDGSHDETQVSSNSWLLGIYKGVCHSLAKPDMPYMG